eukprot:6221176-Prymnesium_polylepis.1
MRPCAARMVYTREDTAPSPLAPHTHIRWTLYTNPCLLFSLSARAHTHTRLCGCARSHNHACDFLRVRRRCSCGSKSGMQSATSVAVPQHVVDNGRPH